MVVGVGDRSMARRGIFVGRFQPLHLGHLKVVKEILEEDNKKLFKSYEILLHKYRNRLALFYLACIFAIAMLILHII